MLTPLNNRVIVKRTEAKETSSGGIILPDAEKEKPNTGVVIASANDALNPGDTILFGNYPGIEIKLNGEKVLIMKFEEIIAKVG